MTQQQQQYRKRFFRANQYQKRIIALAFIPVIIIIVFTWIIMEVFYRAMIGVILYQSSAEAVRMINQWSGIIFVGFLAVLIGTIFWSFSVSLNLVGAFERIIRELDELIDNKSNKTLKARPKDDLANELLKRINVLIEQSAQKNK